MMVIHCVNVLSYYIYYDSVLYHNSVTDFLIHDKSHQWYISLSISFRRILEDHNIVYDNAYLNPLVLMIITFSVPLTKNRDKLDKFCYDFGSKFCGLPCCENFPK